MVRSRVAASRVLPTALVERVTTFAVNIGIWLMAAPEFDKGTLARTPIGPCGQVTGLPDRRQAYGPSPLVKFLHSQRCRAYGHRGTTCGHRAMQVSGQRPGRQDGRCAPSAFPRTATDRVRGVPILASRAALSRALAPGRECCGCLVCQEDNEGMHSDLLPEVAPGRVDGFPGIRGRGRSGRLASCGPSGRAAGNVAHRMRAAVPRAGRPAVAGAAPRVAYGRPCRIRALRLPRACNSNESADGFWCAPERRMCCVDAGRADCASLILMSHRHLTGRADHGKQTPGRWL